MTDAGTLQPKPVSADKAVKLSEGDTYLFFLLRRILTPSRITASR